MGTAGIYGLFVLGGFLLGGAYTLHKTNTVAASILGVLGVLAAIGGLLQLV